jgi:uroporphyrin-3 C-methyltransferase
MKDDDKSKPNKKAGKELTVDKTTKINMKDKKSSEFSSKKDSLQQKNLESKVRPEPKQEPEPEPKIELEQKKTSSVKPKLKVGSENKIKDKKENLFNAKAIPKMESTKSKKINFLSIISLVLLIILLSTSAWLFYQQQLATQSLQDIKGEIQKDLQLHSVKVDSVIQESSQATREINQLKLGLQSLASYNNDLKTQLLSAQEKIKSLSGRRKQDWMLAEVEYIINIAGLKLSLQKDRNTAIQLLKTADDRLIDISDQSLVPIREAIARDISNLSLIQESDITGIVISLGALDLQVNKLQLLALKFEQEQLKENKKDVDLENSPTESESDSLTDLSKIYKRFIKEFIVIKEHAETPRPLMTPDQRGNLNRNISLALQQAQIAALQGNELLFLMNIDKVINWIIQYFGEATESSTVIKQLQELKVQKIDVRYPAKLESSITIEEIKKNQIYNWLDNNLQPSKIKNNSVPEKEKNQVIDELGGE